MKLFNGFVIRSLFIPFTMFALLGCSTLQRTPYSAADAKSSRVLNIGELRRYSDEPASSLKEEATRGTHSGSFSYLAISGGGADGAYGAGILNGWTEAGTRPEFSTVSGVAQAL